MEELLPKLSHPRNSLFAINLFWEDGKTIGSKGSRVEYESVPYIFSNKLDSLRKSKFHISMIWGYLKNVIGHKTHLAGSKNATWWSLVAPKMGDA